MIERIVNHHFVTDHYGYWPEFHDAEIISVYCNRNAENYSPSIEFKIQVSEITNKIIGTHYKLIKHSIIEIELLDVVEMDMKGFNMQNVAFYIIFGQDSELLTMEVNPSYGLAAYVSARQIRIKKLEPKESDQKI